MKNAFLFNYEKRNIIINNKIIIIKHSDFYYNRYKEDLSNIISMERRR